MQRIFISYRRDDTEGQAGRLFQDLREAFGADSVFMDVATIEPGVDFRRAIEKNTASCSVLLALVGRNWLKATDQDGSRRIDNPNDFVRIETASALRRDIPVVPVLVHGAQMPQAAELPDDLKDLAYRNAVELTHARWDSDVQVLIKAIRPLIATGSAKEFSGSAGRTDGRRNVMIVAAAVAVVVLLAAVWLASRSSQQSTSAGSTIIEPSPAPTSQRAVSPEAKTSAEVSTPNASEFTVAANAPWQDTGLLLRAGAGLEIRYVDGLWAGGANDRLYGPEGVPSNADLPNCFPHRQAAPGSLIGRIGNDDSHAFFVGRSAVSPDRSWSGHLFLRMNDCNESLADNRGATKVGITVK